MLENRTYFVVDDEYTTEIEGYFGAITESGRIWLGVSTRPEKAVKTISEKVYVSTKNKTPFVTILIPRTGYIRVTIRSREIVKRGFRHKEKNILLHKLVAQYFVPNPQEYKFVEHIDKNKTNNHYSNLRWIEKNTLWLDYFHHENQGYYGFTSQEKQI